MDKRLLDRLFKMAGQHYTYKGETFLVQGLEVRSENEVLLHTSARTIPFSSEMIAKYFLSDCHPVDPPAPAPPELPAAKDEDISSLTNFLMDNIRKLKDDPSFIPQAQTMAKTAQTIINLKALQLEAYKEMRKHESR